MPERLRIFISSPGDVLAERLRCDLIIDKLAQDYGRTFTIESYRWEHEPLLASGHFQDTIEPPSAADIVLLIVWSRLGTPLPERTALREYRGIDGRAPVTGTEWEYEDALRSARERGAPDILAFRNVTPAAIDTRDPAARAGALAQLDALDVFWRRHFADRGVFLAAYDEYRSLDEFARRLEELLRKLIERRITGRAAAQSREGAVWMGRPFRGLEAYEFEHAAIFFGRDLLVAKAAEQLCAQARAGSAFLLVSGASGSGKSSLVRAAIMPRLMKPHRVAGIGFLRRAAFRPGDGKQDIFLAFVEALTHGGADDAGLPELLRPGQSAADLAAYLRGIADAPAFLFNGALGDLTERARRSSRLLAFEEAKLILFIDQLEELFTAGDVSEQDRGLFARLIAGLARSGAVWVIATIRNDLWHRAAAVPELAALAEGQGRIDVPAPSPAELAEMVRKPAQAAGLAFESHAMTGIGLDAVLAQHAASEPGALPLLSFTLDALYAADIGAGGGHALTYATYEALGGLDGAIATRADEVVAALPADAQRAIPRVLRTLTTIPGGADQDPVARAAPLASFSPGTPARAAVDALVAARLLVASGEEASPSVRVAHEALVSRWRHAREQLAADRRDLEIRALIERQLGRWQAASGRARRQLLLRDPDLANAVDLERRWADELEPSTRDFIRESRRHARLRQHFVTAAAVVFALVAVAAIVLQQQAARERARAEQSYAAAKAAVNGLVFNITQGLRGVEGLRRETIDRILETTRKTVDQLLAENPDDVRLHALRAAMLDEFAVTYQEFGDGPRALASAQESLEIFRRLAAADPGSAPFRVSVAVALTRVGDLKLETADTEGARRAYEEALEIRRGLAAREPDNLDLQRALSLSLDRIADLRRRGGDAAGARTLYEESLAIARRLSAQRPDQPRWLTDVAAGVATIGLLQLQEGDVAGATASFDESLAIYRRAAERAPDDTELQRNVAIGHTRIAQLKIRTGEFAAALAAYAEALRIRRRLALRDPQNMRWQRDLMTTLIALGDLHWRIEDVAPAKAAYEESLAIARSILARDPENAERLRDFSIALERIGVFQLHTGDIAGARTAFAEGLEISRKLAARDPKNLAWQLDIALGHNRVRQVKELEGDLDGARAAADEQVAILRRLVASNAGNAEWQSNFSDALLNLGLLKLGAGDTAGARASPAEGIAVARALLTRDPGNVDWLRGLAVNLNAMGDLHKRESELSEARTVYEESLGIVRTLLARDPSNATWQSDLAFTLRHLGEVLLGLGDSAGALAVLEERVTMARRVAAAGPESAERLRELAFALDALGTPKLAAGDLEGALAVFEEALAVFRKLALREPGNLSWRKASWLALTRIREARTRRDDAPGLRALLEPEIEVLRTLLAQEPTDTGWLRELGVRLGAVGDFKLADGDRDAARAAYDESLAMVRRMLARDPQRVLWRTDLVWALARIGNLLTAAGDKEGARAAFIEALAVVRELESAAALTPQQKDWPTLLEQALARLDG